MKQGSWISRLVGIVKRRMIGFSEIFAFLAIAGSIAGLFAEHHFLLDLCTHFRLQAIAALLGCGTFLIVGAEKKWFGWVSLAVGLGIGMTLLPWFIGKPSLENGPPGLRIFSLNVLTSNLSKNPVIDLILTENPDVVILSEINFAWKLALDAKLSQIYPHRIVNPREDNFGIAAYSKTPFTSTELIDFEEDGVPSVDFLLETPEIGPLRIFGTHPVPPVSTEYWKSRNFQLEAIAEKLAGETIPTIVCGDLNCSPWSPFMKRFIQKSKLRDSARGFGIRPTWTGFSVLLGLPIDHVLHSPVIKVSGRKIIPAPGSDHRAIVVDFEKR